MIIVLKKNVDTLEENTLIHWLETQQLYVHRIQSGEQVVLAIMGDTAEQRRALESNKHILQIIIPEEPYMLVSRDFKPLDTVVSLGNANRIGGGNFSVIAGPCSVEGADQIVEIARQVKSFGGAALRGGAFKPRSSPYAFQGMGYEGLELLKLARAETGLPIVTEILSCNDLQRFHQDVDIIQIGARNMHNFALLKAVGELKKKVLLKRGLSATVEELLLSAEYLMAAGTTDIILCERGIRTYETATRNTLDISAIPVIKKRSHLPVVVDPSHGTGDSHYVEAMSLAAVAAGADGLMIEVHNCPEQALSDGPQSITPEAFKELMRKIWRIRHALSQEE